MIVMTMYKLYVCGKQRTHKQKQKHESGMWIYTTIYDLDRYDTVKPGN